MLSASSGDYRSDVLSKQQQQQQLFINAITTTMSVCHLSFVVDLSEQSGATSLPTLCHLNIQEKETISSQDPTQTTQRLLWVLNTNKRKAQSTNIAISPFPPMQILIICLLLDSLFVSRSFPVHGRESLFFKTHNSDIPSHFDWPFRKYIRNDLKLIASSWR